MTCVRRKIRHILADHNADRKNLFAPTGGGKADIKEVPLSDAERFVIKQLWSEYEDLQAQLLALTKKLKAFAAEAPAREAEARQILKTAPGVGFVTAEVILSELGDVSRFRNAKAVCAYAGLVPVVKQSGGKRSKDMCISKQGSGLLRWALVESAWRLTSTSLRWSALFARFKARGGNRRAIVAVARRLLCALRDAQDVHSVPIRGLGDQIRQADSKAAGQEVDCGAIRDHVEGHIDPGKDRRPRVNRTQPL
jgi:transposase